MGILDVFLVDHGVLHGGIDLGMAQKPLDLFYGHPLVDGPGGQGPSEFVRMDLGDVEFSPQSPEPAFHSADLQPVIGLEQRNKEMAYTPFDGHYKRMVK